MRPLLLVLVIIATTSAAHAATTCSFESVGHAMRLTGDCVTDATLLVPDGVTLDGQHFTIAAIDPVGGHFLGAVVMNAGSSASILDTRITVQGLADVCDTGPARLRGIFFDGAEGTIRGNTVVDINQGASRCPEGIAIEVRNLAPADSVTVEIDHNDVDRYQKAGIVVSGEVDAWIHANRIGASAAQDRVPANALQVGYGAWAVVADNLISGNSWKGFPSTRDAATAVLLFQAAVGTVVRRNAIAGNADIGIYVGADGVRVEDNLLTDEGPDLGGYDIGIADCGIGNQLARNTVRGYQIPLDRMARKLPREVAGLR